MSKGGRPLTGNERKTRYQVMLEPTEAETLRDMGGGNLSRGIRESLTISRLADLHDCKNTSPAEILRRRWPSNWTRRAWIPQSLGDQIWVLFEFKDERDRTQWEASLPELVKKWLDRGLIETAIGYGWHSRDFNGFIVSTPTPDRESGSHG